MGVYYIIVCEAKKDIRIVGDYSDDYEQGLVSLTGSGLQAAIEFAKGCQKNNGGLWLVCEIKEVVGDKKNPI